MASPRLSARAARLAPSEDGAGTIYALFLLVTSLLVGGAAVDVANAWRVQEILQSNAEAAALSAAIRASEPVTLESPRAVAERIAGTGLQAAARDNAWHEGSFEMGRRDPDSGAFLAAATPYDAVRVTLNRDAAHESAEPLMFIGLFGYDPWNIQGQAVAQFRTRGALDCPAPLLSLQTRVDVSELDVFLGICLMANAGVSYGEMPLWRTEETDRLIDRLLVQSLSLPTLELFGLEALTLGDIEDVARTATQHIDISDLDDISVLSDGSVYLDCEAGEVVRLGDGFVVENAAIFSECPIRFEGEVSLRASLVVSNLLSLVRDLDEVRLRPDSILSGSPDCAPGDGVKVLLFADLDAVAGIPALVSTASPLGVLLDDTVEESGTFLSGTLNLLGSIVNPLVRDISEITTNLQLLPICLNATTMLNGDTVVLR
ncbi:TadG family pilus assembly protein [Salipiger sp. H15]|uniref:TadG family pilus assembly protein n=1 Tax=Alloyangia sp. H15 TaxID=3029062 RepID=A0AAU8AGV9_9RHOB